MITSYSVKEPEFCQPTCSEDRPCKGKGCPHKGQKESRSSGSQSKGLETEGDIASQEDGPIRSNQRNSLRNRSHRSNSNEETEKATPEGKYEIENSDVGQPQGVTAANGLVNDNRLLCGVVLGIILVFGFTLLILFFIYAFRKVMQG